MNSTIRSAIVVSALVFSAPGSHANDIVKALDTNGDNLISRQEAQVLPQLFKQFEILDVNRDNHVDAAEIMAYRQP